MFRRYAEFQKAYRKARLWQCSILSSCYRGIRYALLGDSGVFRTHRGWRISRIRRISRDDE